jgi:cell division protease FtsH
MTDNKENKDNKNQNNPFNQFNPNRKDGKPPKFNAYWIYGVIAIVFIVVQFYFSTSRGPVKTTWNEVRSTMLASQDIERIVVVNDKMATVYIKKDRLEKYKTQFETNFSKPAETGPHFTFNIGSVETFENNLKKRNPMGWMKSHLSTRKRETGQAKFYGQSGLLR